MVEKSIQSQIIYQIVDRNNGKPIENASVKVSYQYDYRSTTHSFTKTTDENGEIHFDLMQTIPEDIMTQNYMHTFV